MTDEILKLKTGDNIQVQLVADQNDTRYMVRVIGYEPNVSLLVSTPRANGLPLLVRDGQIGDRAPAGRQHGVWFRESDFAHLSVAVSLPAFVLPTHLREHGGAQGAVRQRQCHCQCREQSSRNRKQRTILCENIRSQCCQRHAGGIHANGRGG
jgi:hypothetical protein